MIRPVLASALIACAASMAVAQTTTKPDRAARYSMAPAEGGGFARLDTETGGMSICQRRDGDWACRNMADDGRQLQQELDRLTTENRQLKDEIKRLEDFVVSSGPSQPKGERPGDTFKLPSEEDVDKALNYVDRMLRKFRDKMKELEGGKGATPL